MNLENSVQENAASVRTDVCDCAHPVHEQDVARQGKARLTLFMPYL